MPARNLVITAILLLTTFATPLLTAQLPTIPSQDLKALEVACKKLARAGLRAQTKTTLTALSDLGYPSRKFKSLQSACDKDLDRPKHSKVNLTAMAEQVRAVGTRLESYLGADAGQRTALAELILKLDDRNDKAHEALGHKQTNGEWKDAWITKLEARRTAVNSALDRARDLSIPIVTTDSSHAILNKVLGRPAAQVRYADITVHSTMSPKMTACILAEAMRASAFANWVLEGELKPGRTRPFDIVLTDRRDIFKKVVAELKTTGVSAADIKRYTEQVHFWDPKNEQFIKYTAIPEEAQSYITFEALRDRPGFLPQPWILGGFFNWVSLSYHGWRIPLYDAVTVTAKDASANATQSIAKAGILGAHAHLAILANQGRAPTLDKSFQHEIGAIHGDNLILAASMVEFLAYQFDFQKLCTACPGKDAIDTPKRSAQLEKATGLTAADLHARWTRWITNRSTSVVGSLTAEANAGGDREAKKLLAQLNGLRAKVLSTIGSAPEVTLDADLSRGCAAHAALLDGDPTAIASTTGSTDIGAWAASHSLIATENTDTKELLKRWMGSLEHRVALLEPGLTRIGFARGKNSVVLDCRSMVQPVREEVMLAWPYDKMTKVPTTAGYPISLQIRRTEESPPGMLTMKLFDGKPSRKQAVECKFLSADTVEHTGRFSPNHYVLIPSALVAGKTYFVVVEFADSDEKHTWSFKT